MATVDAWLLALFMLMLGTLVGFGAAGVFIAYVVVKAATRAPAPPLQPAAAANDSNFNGATVTSLAAPAPSPDAAGDAEDTLPGVAALAARKSRQKPRCAICEAIRAALGLKTKDLSGQR